MKSNARTRPACHQHTGRQWIKVSPMGSIRNSSCPEMSCFFEPDMGLKAPLRQPRPVSGSGKRSAVRLPNNGRWHISSRSSLPDKQKAFFTLLSILFSQKIRTGGTALLLCVLSDRRSRVLLFLLIPLNFNSPSDRLEKSRKDLSCLILRHRDVLWIGNLFFNPGLRSRHGILIELILDFLGCVPVIPLSIYDRTGFRIHIDCGRFDFRQREFQRQMFPFLILFQQFQLLQINRNESMDNGFFFDEYFRTNFQS